MRLLVTITMSALLALVPPDFLDRWLERSGWSLSKLQAGQYELSAEQAVKYLINRDPVLWVERHLIDPTNDRCAWRLTVQQKEALRYPGNLVCRAGAEVGKTWAIVGRTLWLSAVYGQDRLIAAPRDGHLESIWDLLIYQCERVPLLRDYLINWKRTTRRPYRKLVFRRGNVVHLRPSGFAGEAFRGLHVDGGEYDEHAIATRDKQTTEFLRAIREGGDKRFLSTPNGNRQTEFFRFTQEATPFSDLVKLRPEVIDPLEVPPPGHPSYNRFRDSLPILVEFYWPKPSTPFWSERMRREAISLYGSANSPAYLQNVFGLHGQSTDAVYNRERLEQLQTYLAEYRHVEISQGHEGEARLVVWGLNPRFGEEIDWRICLHEEVIPEIRSLKMDAWKGILSPWVEIGDFLGFGGVDIGYKIDPSEIVLASTEEAAKRWLLRVTLLGFDSTRRQARVIRALHDLAAPSLGWALDATGEGKTLYEDLTDEEVDCFLSPELVAAFDLGSAVDDRHPVTGEILIDKATDKARRVTLKTATVDLSRHGVESMSMCWPKDPELLDEWSNFSRVPAAQRGWKYPRHQRDHTIDAYNLGLYMWWREALDQPPGSLEDVSYVESGRSEVADLGDFFT